MILTSLLRHIESSKEALRHIATRDTSWPEYCLSAIDELTSAVKELSKAPEDTSRIPTSGTETSGIDDYHHAATARKTQLYDSARITASNSNQPDSCGPSRPAISPVVISSANLGLGTPEPLIHDNPPQRIPPESLQNTQTFSGMRSQHSHSPLMAGISQPARTSQLTTAPRPLPPPPPAVACEGAETGPTIMPSEGQESMMWYDQLFDSSFATIDNPFLTAAQFDQYTDPTWSHLR